LLIEQEGDVELAVQQSDLGVELSAIDFPRALLFLLIDHKN
jgi:hypothetical protein